MNELLAAVQLYVQVCLNDREIRAPRAGQSDIDWEIEYQRIELQKALDRKACIDAKANLIRLSKVRASQ